MLEWYWFIPLVLFLIFRFIYKEGNPDFWKLTRKHPDKAQYFFESRPDEWRIFYSDEDYRAYGKPEKTIWEGPYNLKITDPHTPIIELYANKATMEKSQQDFIQFIKSNG